ncbi:hypothetical protein [Teredinibacter sp. KSP-S5-2]|uniref:hypothetical protein n=1 Tax=Teredinibacter sp. KSP-S5-2 TaxID=3034506 RepID=UPI00293436DB|nr:hypothetical protein [Teredinibacter sp. KSP-S5-2]WNO11650.1 hypothetical protein P5V12_10750 [Teredinibacter sp. KSP-S5-2]
MDTALQLKIIIDSGTKVSQGDALALLEQSDLVKRLTSDWVDDSLFYIWKVIAMSEIPYAQHLEYTHKLIDRIFNRLAAPFGFSLSGDEKHFLPCYNAMIVTALCRLGLARTEPVLNAVEWINDYQPMERGQSVSIPNLKFDRYGGCFKNTPCYIGLAKSVFALFSYWKATGDTSVSQKLEQGKEYLLEHHLVKRLRDDKPITQHIMDISFPESYHLNIVELIRFAANANLLDDPRAQYAIRYLQDKKRSNGWKMDFRYRSNGYTTFDSGRKNGDWVTHIINSALNGKSC